MLWLIFLVLKIELAPNGRVVDIKDSHIRFQSYAWIESHMLFGCFKLGMRLDWLVQWFLIHQRLVDRHVQLFAGERHIQIFDVSPKQLWIKHTCVLYCSFGLLEHLLSLHHHLFHSVHVVG